MSLTSYILKYLGLLGLCLFILLLSWILQIRNLVFIFLVESSLFFIGDYVIKHKNFDDIHTLFINKFKFSEKRFNDYMKMTKLELIIGWIFVVFSDIALITYHDGIGALLQFKSILSVLQLFLEW